MRGLPAPAGTVLGLTEVSAMQSKLTNLALAFAILALVVSAYAVTRNNGSAPKEPEPSDPPRKVADLERRVDLLTQEVKELRALRPAPREPDAKLIDLADRVPAPTVDDPEAAGDMLRAMVDEAVEKKARAVTEEHRLKADKRPSIGAFAKVLELTDAQRASVEQEVIRAQHEAYSILETPTANNRIPMDILVEIVARSMANPGKDAGYGKWAAWVRAEKVPGSDDTYSSLVDAVKGSLADNLRQILGKEQFSEFSAWKPDPINIRGIPGSPGEDLRRKIEERARALGATIPEREDR